MLRTFVEQREEGQKLTGPYFAAAHALLADDKRDEALTVLREMPSEPMSLDAHLEYAQLLRAAGDLYGSYPFFEQAHSMAGKNATALVELAKTKLRIADDLSNGAKEQLLWEAVELLREAGPLWQEGGHEYIWDMEVEGYTLLAQTLERPGMPLAEIDEAFQYALAWLTNDDEEPKIRAEYEAWKQRTAPARRRSRTKRPS